MKLPSLSSIARLATEAAHAAKLDKARTTVAVGLAQLATVASQKSGRGSGGMIGGLIAEKIDPEIMANLCKDRPVAIVTGTNGKSTTTRMLANAVRTAHTVATNDKGDNMDAGIISALMAGRDASHIILECDEMHVPSVVERLKPTCLVLLNLSRDQLDRVGEINTVERRLRETVAAHPEMTVVANVDDIWMTSAAYDAKNVVWVSAGSSWQGDAVSCPRTDSNIVHNDGDWYATGTLEDGSEFRRPTPTWSTTDELLRSPEGEQPLQLSLPGKVNRGNAAQAIAAAVTCFDIDLTAAIKAVAAVHDVAGRYSTITIGEHTAHLLLAKNPASWQEAMNMVDRTADGLVIAINGQVADGEDLSWLWDVKFESFGDLPIKATGERGTDLAVRLTYAEIEHELIEDMVASIKACPPGRIEVLANYTAFRDLKRALARAATKGA